MKSLDKVRAKYTSKERDSAAAEATYVHCYVPRSRLDRDFPCAFRALLCATLLSRS